MSSTVLLMFKHDFHLLSCGKNYLLKNKIIIREELIRPSTIYHPLQPIYLLHISDHSQVLLLPEIVEMLDEKVVHVNQLMFNHISQPMHIQ